MIAVKKGTLKEKIHTPNISSYNMLPEMDQMQKRKGLSLLFAECQKMLPLFYQCLIYKSHMLTTTKHKYEARKL